MKIFINDKPVDIVATVISYFDLINKNDFPNWNPPIYCQNPQTAAMAVILPGEYLIPSPGMAFNLPETALRFSF